jgi:putative DNA primase/helicase
MSTVPDERAQAEAAIFCIPATVPREVWWRLAAALKHAFGDGGWDIFLRWSRDADNFEEAAARDTWKSVSGNKGITLGTLFSIAQEYGYERTASARVVIDRDELKKRRVEREEQAKAEAAQRLIEARKAAATALAVLSKAVPAGADHPYLQRKGVAPVGTLRELGVEVLAKLIGYKPASSGEHLTGRILVAPVDVDGKLSTIEMIDETGRKAALKGGIKSGGYWSAMPLDSATRIIVAEGIATALSAQQCAGATAVAALSCGNLRKAAQALAQAYPGVPLTILADIGNGAEDARKAADAVGAALATPDFGADRHADQTDFNDLHCSAGAAEVARQIEAAQPLGFPGLKDRPCYRLYERGVVVEGRKVKPGVYWHSSKAEKNDEPPALIDKWISTPLRILATTSNGEDAEYGRLLEIRSPAGKWKKWAMPMSMLAGDGSEARGVLLSEGLVFDLNDRNAILRYVAAQVPSVRMRAASVTGWNRDAFVLPHTVIGANDIWFQASGRTAPYATAGSFDEWKNLAALASSNSLLMLALSAAMAGPLLGPLNIEGAGIHIYGDSSTGKTTAEIAAVSVWGGPHFKRTWRATANGLEGAGTLHSDTLLALDELGEIDPKSLYEAAYALINGTGKTRANRHGEAKAAARWRVLLLSTGELTIAARMIAGGFEAKAGQELRILDVPVQERYGLFEDLHGRASGSALSDEIRNKSAQHYGHAGPMFVEALIRALRDGLTLSDELHAITERMNATEGQERRAARTFALCGLAGELAARWNVVPWTAGEATRAAAHAFSIWRKRRGASGGSSEHGAIMRAVSDFIDRHSDSRFSNVEGSVDIIRDRAGYWKQDGARRLYLFTSVGLREATKGFDLLRVTSALHKAGALAATDLDKRSKKTRDPTGRSVSLYHVDPEALDPDR